MSIDDCLYCLLVTFAGQPALDERSVKTAVSTIVTYQSEDEALRGVRKDLILGTIINRLLYSS